MSGFPLPALTGTATAFKNKTSIAYNNRGDAYDNKGQTERAITDYGKAIEINPRFAMAYNNRAYAYEKKKLRDKAIADYRAALEINPSSDWTRKALKRLGAEP